MLYIVNWLDFDLLRHFVAYTLQFYSFDVPLLSVFKITNFFATRRIYLRMIALCPRTFLPDACSQAFGVASLAIASCNPALRASFRACLVSHMLKTFCSYLVPVCPAVANIMALGPKSTKGFSEPSSSWNILRSIFASLRTFCLRRHSCNMSPNSWSIAAVLSAELSICCRPIL